MTRMPWGMPTEWYFAAAAAHPPQSKESLDYAWAGRTHRDLRAWGGEATCW